jgi:serine/threonine protein phosphatase PrpC/predicted  nucleic acid-binding Zn-ribbon protein
MNTENVPGNKIAYNQSSPTSDESLKFTPKLKQSLKSYAQATLVDPNKPNPAPVDIRKPIGVFAKIFQFFTQIPSKTEEMSETRSKLEKNLKPDLVKYNTVLNSIKNNIKIEKNEIKKANKEINNLSNDLVKLEEKLSKMEENSTSHETQLTSLKKTIETKEHNLINIQAERKTDIKSGNNEVKLTYEVLKLKEKLSKMEKNSTSHETQLTSLKARIKDKKTRIDDIRKGKDPHLNKLLQLRTEWHEVRTDLDKAQAKLARSVFSGSKELNQFKTLGSKINSQFQDFTKNFEGSGGYELNQIKNTMGIAHGNIDLHRDLLQEDDPIILNKAIAITQSSLTQLEQIRRDHPTDPYIGNLAHELSAKAKMFLFEQEAADSLPLTLNHHSQNRVMDGEYLAKSEFVKQNLIDPLPNTKLVGIGVGVAETTITSNNCFTVDGINKMEGDEKYEVENNKDRVSGFSKTTAIHDPKMGKTQNNDSFGTTFGKGWELSIVADGSSLQPSSRIAADKAKVAFQASMNEQLNTGNIKTVQDVGRAVLKALDAAQDESNNNASGKTTFTMSFIFKVKGGEKMALVAGVGDSPAALRKKDGKVQLLTPGMRDYTTGPNDSGGQMGADGLKSNNLFMTAVRLEEGDALVLGSDGMFDNFDPGKSNQTPLEAFNELEKHKLTKGLQKPDPKETWEHSAERSSRKENPVSEHEARKTHLNLQTLINRYHEHKLEQLWGEENANPESMNTQVWNHCNKLTEESRHFMREREKQGKFDLEGDIGEKIQTTINGESKEVTFLGKIDDVTSVVHLIGKEVGLQ